MAVPVFKYSKAKQIELINLKKHIEGNTLLTHAESRILQNEIAELQENVNKELLRKEAQIEKLKNELKEKSSLDNKSKPSNEPTKTTSKAKAKTESISKEEIDVILLLANQPHPYLESAFVKNYKHGHINGKYALQELENKGFIQKEFDQYHEQNSYELTHKGRTYIIEKGLLKKNNTSNQKKVEQ